MDGTELGEFFVTLTAWSAEGCQSRVVHGPYSVLASDLFIPNVFSPNDDGLNDIFLLNYTGSQPLTLRVYDRWGISLFNTANKLTGWDGRNADGQPVTEGVYYYQVTVGDKAYTGTVTLVR